MGRRHARWLLACGAPLLLAACHGPPIMARISPRYAPPRDTQPSPHAAPAQSARSRAAAALRAPFYAEEGRPESVVTDRMIDEIERAVLLRQKARRAAADPCSQAIERARCMKYGPKVGQEERGSIPLPVMPLLKLLKKELSK